MDVPERREGNSRASSAAPPASDAVPRAVPARLGRYDVLAKIADGGMATLYLGRETGADRLVALKVIKDEFSLNREFVDMFLDEAKIVSKLSHPNVVTLYELGTEGNRLFIAMELLQGQSLWSVWEACRRRRVRVRYDTAAWIGARVAEGLHHAHELVDAAGAPLHVVHRDVNASNIFLTYDGRVKVIDFGLAKARNRISRTAAGIVKGKLAYMSPEQTVGKPLDRRTDVFALATTLWELTCDRRLFKGPDDVATLTAVHDAKVPDPTTLIEGYPPKLWAVLKKALARDREKRYATALDMARALDAVAQGEQREVTQATVAEVMRTLFDNERARVAAWIAEVSEAAPHRHMKTLRPPARDAAAYEAMGSRGEPAPGTFVASAAGSDSLEVSWDPEASSTSPTQPSRRREEGADRAAIAADAESVEEVEDVDEDEADEADDEAAEDAADARTDADEGEDETDAAAAAVERAAVARASARPRGSTKAARRRGQRQSAVWGVAGGVLAVLAALVVAAAIGAAMLHTP